jgi:hypothetical protein
LGIHADQTEDKISGRTIIVSLEFKEKGVASLILGFLRFARFGVLVKGLRLLPDLNVKSEVMKASNDMSDASEVDELMQLI